MKIDRLNIETFKNKDGGDYRKAEVMERSEIEKHFTQKGYNVLDFQQLWRHVHGKLEKDGKIFFFKMASTPGIGERTRNETSWNAPIHDKIKESGIDCFDVPVIHETGDYSGRYYYLADFHEGPFLATDNPINTEKLDQWLDKIVEVNLFLLSLEDITFYRDEGLQKRVDDLDDFNSVGTWYEGVKEHDLKEVFDEIEKLRETYEPAINHGDFVPWHMIEEGDKFTLIDAEHATGRFPRYLDIVYFYHRVYTSANNPELAKKYLNKIRDSFSEAEKEKFEKSIRPILAIRIIGGFQDAKAHDVEDLTYHNKLKEDFLKHDLY